LFVGRLEQYKGAQFILEAMRQIPEASLLVVGDGSYRPQLEQWANQLDVEFAGFQNDPARFYEQSTVFINPSMGPEGLPLVSLEAMAHGLPCLFSDLPVHREISLDGNAAALFQCGNSDDLAYQLKALLANSSVREQYSRAARQLVENKYSAKAAAGRYVQAFGLS
jgi:glycosyltransferase involved in cell wall biosynthesis